MVSIPGLVMRVLRRDPMTVAVRRVTIIAPDPDVLPVLPFVVSRNPDCGVIGLGPLLIILTRRRRRLVSDVENHSLSASRNVGSEKRKRREHSRDGYLNR